MCRSSFIYRTSSKGKEHWLSVNQPACDCVDSLWITDIHVLCSVFTSGWHWLLCNTQDVSVNGVAYALCISGIQILSVGKFHCLLNRFTCIKLIDSYIQSDSSWGSNIRTAKIQNAFTVQTRLVVFSHRNVIVLFLSLFTIAGKPVMIITEYMENGSLDMFLRVRLCLSVSSVSFYIEIKSVLNSIHLWISDSKTSILTKIHWQIFSKW